MKTDAQLQWDVLEELQAEPSIDATQIGVTVRGGVVTLTGHVPVYAQKFTAEEAARRVRGVKAVANDLEVRLSDGGRRSDTDIAAAVVSALQWDAAVPDERIQATVRDGWITLGGIVDWQFQKEAADCAVRPLIGARGVTNSILVKPRVQPADIAARMRAAIARSAVRGSQGIRVESHDGTAVLRGDVHSLAEREEAERVAWSVPGVSRVQNDLMVTPRGD
jgi:osmotically-inducible protein OsmY